MQIRRVFPGLFIEYVLLLILSAGSSCEANSVLCQHFDEQSESLEKYCENYTNAVPKECGREIEKVEPYQVRRLKICGCDSVTVLDSITNFRDVREIDISHSGYETLDWLDLNLERLDVFNASHNALSSIELFRNSVSTPMTIDLSHNELKRIESGSFRGADKLLAINLSHNSIHTISEDLFMNSTHLQFIDLSDNRFWSVPIFPRNKMLRELRLLNNPVLTFSCSEVSTLSSASLHFPWKSAISFHGDGQCAQKPMHVVRDINDDGIMVTADGTHELHCNEQSFLNLTILVAGSGSFANVGALLQCLGSSIMYMDLADNFIGVLNAAVFERFDGLVALSLSNTMLIDFDVNMLNSKYLMKLDLSFNQLKRLRNPEALRQLDHLEELDIGGNNVENVMEVIQHLRESLQKLNPFGNRLGLLNANTFQDLTALRVLNLSNTQLHTSDLTALQTLWNLEVLDISLNDFSNINMGWLSSFSRLTKLNAAQCGVANIASIVDNLGPSIRELDLSANPIGALNVSFESLTNLTFLNLSATGLEDFYLDTLEHQHNLRVLDLSSNSLSRISLVLVTKRLSYLDLTGNQLEEIFNFDHNEFPHLMRLGLSRNQLPCDYLRVLRSEWAGLTFMSDPFEQNHGRNCYSNIQAFTDFLGSAYEHFKLW